MFGMVRLFCVMAVVSAPAWADVTVNTSLDSFLQIDPAAGTVNYLYSPTGSTFAQALDTLGGFDQNFGGGICGTAPTVASTTLANASGGVSLSTLEACTTANVNLHDINAFASSVGQATLSGVFYISGVTGPVSVTFNGVLTDNQFLEATPAGLFGSSESIYTLTLPDIQFDPILWFDNLLTIGPGQTSAYAVSPTLTTTLLLQPNTDYSFVVAADAESFGVDSTPEPSSIALLITVVCGAGFSLRRVLTRPR
jgi:hypothetical protein